MQVVRNRCTGLGDGERLNGREGEGRDVTAGLGKEILTQ